MGNTPSTQPRVSLAEVVAALSLATDLAHGQPLEHGLRRALLAVWLGEELGLSEEEVRDAYYVALLGSVGCAAQAATFATLCGDEIAFGERLVLVDPSRPFDVATFFLGRVGEGDPPLRRAGKLLSLARGLHEAQTIARDAALQVGELLDLGPSIRSTALRLPTVRDSCRAQRGCAQGYHRNDCRSSGFRGPAERKQRNGGWRRRCRTPCKRHPRV